MRLRGLFAGLLVGALSGGVSGPVNPPALDQGLNLLQFPVGLRAVLRASLGEQRAAPATPAGQASAGTGALMRPDGRRLELRSRHAVIGLLSQAAARHQVDSSLVLALSYWESAWDQRRTSSTGAIGLMQIQPEVAAAEGPRLLGRQVDLDDAYDNADLGAAILKANLDAYGSKEMALAAYYQGSPQLENDGPYPDTLRYVDGILALAGRIASGDLPDRP